MNTKALRQKILDLAIHGKLVPQDPNDEPASVLLERIRSEKERLIKEGKIKRPKKTKATSDKPHYPYELPKGWVWTTLGEIGNWQSGATPSRLRKDYYGGNIPWLKTGDLNDGYISDIPEYITETALKETSVKLNPKDSVLIAMYGATIGKVGILSFPATTNQACCACTDYLVKKMYLFYFLLANRENFIAMGGGGAQPNISKEKIVSTLIPLPPTQEQIRIVEGIEHWFSLVDCIEGNKDNLQKIIKEAKSKILTLAIHGKLVPQDPTDEPAAELLKRINPKAEITCDNGHYQKLPEGWCLTTLGSIGHWQSGATPSRLRKEYYGGSIPWLKTGDLNDGIITNIPEFITEKALAETSVKLNPSGSVLIAMYGATIGKVGILSFPATTNQACCACVNYKLEQMYLFYFLLANRESFIRMGGGGAQPNISKEKITNTVISLPPLEEQHRIVAKIEEIFAQLDAIEASL